MSRLVARRHHAVNVRQLVNSRLCTIVVLIRCQSVVTAAGGDRDGTLRFDQRGTCLVGKVFALLVCAQWQL